MKKILTIITLVLTAFLTLPAPASGQAKQAKIQTRKVKLSDFTTKTTKVVLCGGSLFDDALQEEMARRWLVSPYEFCSLAEYEKLKSSPDYYFLIPASTKTKKEAEPGIVTLTLLGDRLKKWIIIPKWEIQYRSMVRFRDLFFAVVIGKRIIRSIMV